MRKFRWFLGTLALTVATAAVAQVTYSNRPPLPPDYYGNPQAPGYYGQQQAPGYANQTVSCGSPQYRLMRCPVPPNWRGVELLRQTSKSACVAGQTYGFDRGGVWVDKGCGGIFAATRGWQPGPGWNRDFGMSCGSPQYKYYFCQVDVGARGRVILQQQTSDTRCIEGRNWGWNRAGIWVDKGCSARFLVDRRW